MVALGYYYQIVWLNSMFCPPTPQSRDRMYVVFWKKGIKPPNLTFEPPSWCAGCETVVDGHQTWKKPDRPWGRYGVQYYFICQSCGGTVLPGVHPAASAIDWSLPAERIGDRKRPLAEATRNRILRGLERLANEPFAIRLTHGGAPKPLTLPVVTLTRRHDMAMVMPVGGNLYERTPGNRVRDPERRPFDTVHTSFSQAVVMRNNSGGGEMSTPPEEPFRTLTGGCHQSLVMSYHRTGTTKDADTEPTFTVTTRDRLAMVIPFTRNGRARDVDRDVVQTLATEGPPGLALTEDDIDDCRFRMFALHEIADVMTMRQHADGSEYQVLGNKRERMAQYGNAVTPPVMQELVGRLLKVI
jgi:DNA (cytosine-5)-methyltransferase 1